MCCVSSICGRLAGQSECKRLVHHRKALRLGDPSPFLYFSFSPLTRTHSLFNTHHDRQDTPGRSFLSFITLLVSPAVFCFLLRIDVSAYPSLSSPRRVGSLGGLAVPFLTCDILNAKADHHSLTPRRVNSPLRPAGLQELFFSNLVHPSLSSHSFPQPH